ncbi:MAG: DUF1553 domain-containing protein [Planctomycetes bacterium]|nr:DUF1553 domain-containing protein [Planctomycetota bacterium]
MFRRRFDLLFPAFLAGVLAVAGAAPAQQANDWWAYRRLERPAVPAVSATGDADGATAADWCRGAIDRFVLAGLQRAGLTPAPAADRHTLLRRVTYDLTGLPPTAVEIAAFVADDTPDAFERVVDRLLASEQYGVKWGRHWLDLVRYAETDGYERDRQKPFIWRYRDWVVDALNADMPYAEFLRRQLAGDEQSDASVADLVATGYYRLGIWDDEPTDPLQARYDDLDGIADTTARVMLGISMGCARCHDHKRDPLPQRDYYSFLAFFEQIATYDLQARTVPADGALADYDAEMAAYDQRHGALTAQIRAAATHAFDDGDPAERAQLLAAAAAAVVASYGAEDLSATELRDDRGRFHGHVEGQVVAVRDGQSGSAMRFDGDDAVLLPRVVADSFTVSFFVRSDQRGTGELGAPRWTIGAGLVDGEVEGVQRDWGIAWDGAGRVVAGTGAPDKTVASSSGLHDGRWHHVAFTRDRSIGRIALYVDGALVGHAMAGKQTLDAPATIAVGRRAKGGGGFRGDLDELVFFDRPLAASEVTALALALPGGIAAPALVSADPAAAADAADRTKAFFELQGLQRPSLATLEILGVREREGEAEPSYVRLRGNAHSAGEQVGLAFPAMLGASAPVVEGGRRRSALACWITDPGNPLTWRVIANRLWQHHFGRGLSRTPNDFGRLGEAPTHPELLDWLACEVIAQGGSLKAMHRLIVTSAAYRMSSLPRPAAAAVDPQNDRFWRFDRRRLTAEEIRDTTLAVSGELELALGGPWVFPPLPAQVLQTASRPEAAWGTSTPAEAARRSLYVHTKRSLQEPLLAAFDKADTDNSCPVRFATVQATQSLILLNGEFAQREAARLATRLTAEAATLRDRLALGLRLVTQRPEREADVERLVALHGELVRDHGRDPALALQRCCLVLLNCNEMIYLD